MVEGGNQDDVRRRMVVVFHINLLIQAMFIAHHWTNVHGDLDGLGLWECNLTEHHLGELKIRAFWVFFFELKSTKHHTNSTKGLQKFGEKKTDEGSGEE